VCVASTLSARLTNTPQNWNVDQPSMLTLSGNQTDSCGMEFDKDQKRVFMKTIVMMKLQSGIQPSRPQQP